MTGKYRDDPLVDLDRGRLEIAMAQWLRRRPQMSRAEIARRAETSPQRLDILMKGANRRCRRSLRAELARVLGCSVGFLAGKPEALPPGSLAEEYETLRRGWLKRGVADERANDLALSDVSGGMVFEAIERLRQAEPDLSEPELESRALAETKTRLPLRRSIRMGNAVVQYTPDDETRNALDAIDAEAVAIARAIATALCQADGPADSNLLLGLQDLLNVRFWRSLLRVGCSDVTEADSAAFAGAMGDVIRMALKPYLTGKEKPSLIALPELRDALKALRHAGIIAATNGRASKSLRETHRAPRAATTAPERA